MWCWRGRDFIKHYVFLVWEMTKIFVKKSSDKILQITATCHSSGAILSKESKRYFVKQASTGASLTLLICCYSIPLSARHPERVF